MRMFPHGVVLPFRKDAALRQPIEPLVPAQPMLIPIANLTAGEEAPSLMLPVGQTVPQGAVLTRDPDGFPAVATVSGTVTGTVTLTHPQYGDLLCATLEPQSDYAGEERVLFGSNTADEVLSTLHDTASAASDGTRLAASLTRKKQPSADEMLEILRLAGVYDELDGAALAEKLTVWRLPENDPAARRCILVADGTENDVFGSAAWAVLEESPERVLDGLRLLAKILGFPRCHIATMLPKKRRTALRTAVGKENVYIVPDEYPVTRYADSRDEVFRVGVQACAAASRAIREGIKNTAAVVTVTGDEVLSSRNLRIPYGTPLREILTAVSADPSGVTVLGDSMTGVVCRDLDLPLLPGTTTLLVLPDKPRPLPQPCIGCGRCAAVCHAGLLPYEIVRRQENMHYERLQHLSAWECDGCGVCSYVCPAHRNVTLDVLRAGESGNTVFLHWGDEDAE